MTIILPNYEEENRIRSIIRSYNESIIYYSGKDDFQKLVAKTLYLEEVQPRVVSFLNYLKQSGYEQLLLGTAGDKLWGNGGASNSMLFCTPKRKIGSWPDIPLWKAVALLGGSACGNGLTTCDQSQLGYNVERLFKDCGFDKLIFNLQEEEYQ